MDFGKRLLSSIVLVIIFLPLLFLGGYFFYSFLALLTFIGVFEVLKAAGFIKKVSLPFTLALSGFAATIVVCFMIYDMIGTNVLHFAFAGGALLFALILALPIMVKELKVSDSFFIIGTFCYVCLGFILMGKIRTTEFAVQNPIEISGLNYNFRTSGLLLYTYALGVCLATDVFAYLIGSKFGKKKLCVSISPKKTVGGSVAGLVAGTIAGVAIMILAIFVFDFYLFPTSAIGNIIITIFLSMFLSLCCQVGDLIASKLKREFNVKDFSNILPGHGGIMDRFDSMLFVILIFGSLILFLGIL